MSTRITAARRWLEEHGPLAGAMLFVISREIIPETHHHKGHETVATVGLMAGFVVMMPFDTILG